MKPALPRIPLKYASLIIRYTHNLLSDTEHDELDRWLEDSDDNLQIFEELTDGMEGKIFSADDLIIETDDLLNTWMIAGLMARQMQGIITADEERALQNWVTASRRAKPPYGKPWRKMIEKRQSRTGNKEYI